MTDRMINNDFHPDDKGLNASQEDHWGTMLNDMIQKDESRRREMSTSDAAKKAIENERKNEFYDKMR